jgi:chromate transporter
VGYFRHHQSGFSSLRILLFFPNAGSFVFGSGLAIIPFLYQGVVQQFGWLTEQQFLDAVAVAMITPGPAVITVAFIGFLVARLPGDFFTIISAPWFKTSSGHQPA